MPTNEREYHPYLFQQIPDFNNVNILANYDKLVVGTFPIYAITDSDPIENIGRQKRINWEEEAHIQYFYGSVGNNFWHLISGAFGEDIPQSIEQAISLLNRQHILLTDVYIGALRNGYSPADNDLVDPLPNHYILNLMENNTGIRTIYFTGIDAKKAFCRITNVDCPKSKQSIVNISGRQYTLIDLITPAGNARSAFHYRNILPFTHQEIQNRINGNGYALAYRQRYYSHFLNLRNN